MKSQKAFSMIELVFVIVVMGILASLAMPRMDRDLRQEAIDSVMADIRLAQRMAVSDHRHDVDNSGWQKSYWQWRVEKCDNGNLYYIVGSDNNYNNSITQAESAIDPYNQKYLFASSGDYCVTDEASSANSDRVLLTKKFGISSATMNDKCTSSHIAFDELGRLHINIHTYTVNDYKNLQKTDDCEITFTFDNGLIDDTDPFTLVVEAITGRVSLKK